MTTERTSYDVRIWRITEYRRAGGRRTYGVRWAVAGERHHQTFASRPLADSFRADLLAAARRGVPFRVDSGLPMEHEPSSGGPSWYEHAVQFVEAKWPQWAPRSRQSIADALATVTPVLVTTTANEPLEPVLRKALYQWAFNRRQQRLGSPPRDVVKALEWIARNSMPLTDLEKASVLHAALNRLSRTLAGEPAAANTISRRRAGFSNALGYAVELGYLPVNPLKRIKWTTPKISEQVDRRSVVNHEQAIALLRAVREQGAPWNRLEAFFAVMYYAALRPAEATLLTNRELELPEAGWGQLHFGQSSPAVGRAWTDSGGRESRQLKHRAVRYRRDVPCPPQLTAILNRHLAEFGTAADGRLFPGAGGGLLSDSIYGRVWQAARAKALSAEERDSPLAKRPYDLRHAAVSTWLNAGVDPTQVAEWAGHSVQVLLRVYAKCIVGRDEISRQRIERFLEENGSGPS